MGSLQSRGTGFSSLIGGTAISRSLRGLSAGLTVGLLSLVFDAVVAAPAEVIVTQISKSGDTIEVDIRFACPNRFLDYSPKNSSERFEISLMRMDRCANAEETISMAIRPPGRELADLEEVEYTARNGTEATVRLQFGHAVLVMVEQAGNLRSLRLLVKETVGSATESGQGPATLNKMEQSDLLAQARQAIIDKNYPRAIELTTIILKEPPGTQTAEARELLGVVRERNGEIELAVAEYRRYLQDYPDENGAVRVRQRLAALTVPPGQSGRIGRGERAVAVRESSWKAAGSFSQHYLRNSSDLGGQGGWFTESVLLTDGDFAARYRGDRFNYSTRTTAVYRYNVEESGWSGGSESRFNNLYMDLEDWKWGLSGRLGRQRMQTDGVLGLIDGLHLSWQMLPKIRLNATTGYPVYSSAQGFDTERKLYGASVDFTRLLEGLDVNVFFNTQTIDGIENRQAVGGQVRYVDDRNSFIGAIDYDIGFNKIVSFNLLGNRTYDSGLNISASADYRRFPFLTTENALIGQTAGTIDELLQSLTEDQIRNLALDRSGEMLTYSLGLSRPLARHWAVNGDFIFTQLAQGPGSGGVLILPDSADEYYVYASLIGSSLIAEGDVSILGLRYGDTYAARIYSLYLDSRYPVTSKLQLNPRLEVSERRISVDRSNEWLLIPRLRLLYRLAGHFEIELEGGFEQGNRTGGVVDTDTRTYYFYVGYRADF